MKVSRKTDYELVEEFIAGGESAIEILIKRHKNRVFTYIMLMVKNEQLAEDIFQDTFIKVIHSLKAGKYKDNGRFLSWVIRIAHNLVIDHFRKEKQMNTLSNDSTVVDLFNNKKLAEKNIEDTIIYEQICQDIRTLIERLPEDQKEVILLRHYGDLSFKEIAEQTGVSINTALGRMRYALINLRKMVEKHDISLSIP
ncbi:MAG: sigma-70 family RNA polymerase sigma factor [Bacteroidales bacterium]|nr:sigma-70 family RNA polymerase sigma factor [Bacteroidales bacterium]MCB9013241.1 sigma-70 family RNA polymerase sigma factor [Bacteroidales bacterium]